MLLGTGGDIYKMARLERFELPTNWFEASYSIQLSYRRVTLYHTCFLRASDIGFVKPVTTLYPSLRTGA